MSDADGSAGLQIIFPNIAIPAGVKSECAVCWMSVSRLLDFIVSHRGTYAQTDAFSRWRGSSPRRLSPVHFLCLIWYFSCRIPTRQFAALARWKSPIRKQVNGRDGRRMFRSFPGPSGQTANLREQEITDIASVLPGKCVKRHPHPPTHTV